jgi:hypothetical protein
VCARARAISTKYLQERIGLSLSATLYAPDGGGGCHRCRHRCHRRRRHRRHRGGNGVAGAAVAPPPRTSPARPRLDVLALRARTAARARASAGWPRSRWPRRPRHRCSQSRSQPRRPRRRCSRPRPRRRRPRPPPGVASPSPSPRRASCATWSAGSGTRPASRETRCRRFSRAPSTQPGPARPPQPRLQFGRFELGPPLSLFNPFSKGSRALLCL